MQQDPNTGAVNPVMQQQPQYDLNMAAQYMMAPSYGLQYPAANGMYGNMMYGDPTMSMVSPSNAQQMQMSQLQMQQMGQMQISSLAEQAADTKIENPPLPTNIQYLEAPAPQQ